MCARTRARVLACSPFRVLARTHARMRARTHARTNMCTLYAYTCVNYVSRPNIAHLFPYFSIKMYLASFAINYRIQVVEREILPIKCTTANQSLSRREPL